jgi:dephospho-CoA kinase
MDDGWNNAGDKLVAEIERDGFGTQAGLDQYPDIALIGKAGAGKTTAAEYLVDKCGYTRVSFAQPLKDIAVQIWGRDAATDRAKLQGLGCAVRDIESDAWCNMAVRRIHELRRLGNGATRFVVDDCRFPNEYWALKELGFVVVRVWAPRNVRVVRLRGNGKLQDESQLEHVSETALDDFAEDYDIANEFEPGAFTRQIREIVLKESTRV